MDTDNDRPPSPINDLFCEKLHNPDQENSEHWDFWFGKERDSKDTLVDEGNTNANAGQYGESELKTRDRGSNRLASGKMHWKTEFLKLQRKTESAINLIREDIQNMEKEFENRMTHRKVLLEQTRQMYQETIKSCHETYRNQEKEDFLFTFNEMRKISQANLNINDSNLVMSKNAYFSDEDCDDDIFTDSDDLEDPADLNISGNANVQESIINTIKNSPSITIRSPTVGNQAEKTHVTMDVVNAKSSGEIEKKDDETIKDDETSLPPSYINLRTLQQTESMATSRLPGMNEELEQMKVDDLINSEVFLKLQEIFNEADEDGIPGLNMDEFKHAMKQTMSSNLGDRELEMIFMKVDTNCDETVDWQEYLSYMLLEYKEKDLMAQMAKEIPYPTPLRHIPNTMQRDGIIAFLHMRPKLMKDTDMAELHSTGRYMSVTKDGVLTFWSLDMKKQKVAYLERQNSRLWITAVVNMPNINTLGFSTTAQDIFIYDFSGNLVTKYCRITNLKASATCMHYWHDHTNMSRSILFWGDIHGGVYAISFTESTNAGLFGNLSSRKMAMKEISFNDIAMGKFRGTRVYKFERLHEELVNQIMYVHSMKMFLSCSCGNDTSLFLGDLEEEKKASWINVPRGFLCMDYCRINNVLITGGVDQLVRVWNPYVTKKAVAVLTGHSRPIIHVFLDSIKEWIISIAMDKAIRIYDLKDQSCIQMIRPSQIDIGNWRIGAAFVNKKTHALFLCSVRVSVLEHPGMGAITTTQSHKDRITAALYNKLFNVVVSCTHGSEMAVWDLDTGEKVMQSIRMHEYRESGEVKIAPITAFAFDRSLRRMITGTANGLLKIWNFNNGEMLRDLSPLGKIGQEITGIACGHAMIYAVGWSRVVYAYSDDPELKEQWRKQWFCKHHDDILTIDINGQFLATGAYDGDVLIWNTEMGKLYYRFNPNVGTRPALSFLDEYMTKQKEQEYFLKQTRQSLLPKLPKRTPNTSFLGGYDKKQALVDRPITVQAKASTMEIDVASKPIVWKQQFTKIKDSFAHRENMEHTGFLMPKGQSFRKNSYQIRPSSIGRTGSGLTFDLTKYKSRVTRDRVPKTRTGKLLQTFERSIDVVLFLKTRRINIPTVATLVATGGSGWVRFWSLHPEGGLLGQFCGTQDFGQCVLAMTSDSKNNYLFTGDTEGYIKVWNIRTYCTSEPLDAEEEQFRNKDFPFLTPKTYKSYFSRMKYLRAKAKPPKNTNPKETVRYPALLNSFRSHLQAIISIEFIEDRQLLITSSTDKSIRMWTVCGRFIGTFGDKEKWRLAPVNTRLPVDPVRMKHRVPEDVRQSASFTTMQIIHGSSIPMWKKVRNIWKFWGSMLKLKPGETSSLANAQMQMMIKDPLGHFFRLRMAHRQACLRCGIEYHGHQVRAYNMLPYADLEEEPNLPNDMPLIKKVKKAVRLRKKLEKFMSQYRASKQAQITTRRLRTGRTRKLFESAATGGTTSGTRSSRTKRSDSQTPATVVTTTTSAVASKIGIQISEAIAEVDTPLKTPRTTKSKTSCAPTVCQSVKNETITSGESPTLGVSQPETGVSAATTDSMATADMIDTSKMEEKIKMQFQKIGKRLSDLKPYETKIVNLMMSDEQFFEGLLYERPDRLNDANLDLEVEASPVPAPRPSGTCKK